MPKDFISYLKLFEKYLTKLISLLPFQQTQNESQIDLED
jgi:hypothetical protein